MIDFNHEIKSLLFEHDYVTIPGFGAFIANYEPSTYDAETNCFTPPDRKISFNSVLKQDDGLLTSVVMKKANLSSVKARELINNYVKEFKSSLLLDQTVELAGVGTFDLSPEQKVIFSPLNQNFYNESYGFETIYSFNTSNFTYAEKYFEDANTTELDAYEFETMNITMSKGQSKPFYSKILYATPLIVLALGLVTVLVFNPTTEKIALSSLNPVDYVSSVKNWFSASVDETALQIETPEILPPATLKDIPARTTERLVVGIFSQPENATRLYNKLVLNNFSPEVVLENDKSVVFFPVNEFTNTDSLSARLEQFIGERGVIVKN